MLKALDSTGPDEKVAVFLGFAIFIVVLVGGSIQTRRGRRAVRAEYDAAVRDYEEAVHDYEAALRRWKRSWLCSQCGHAFELALPTSQEPQ